ncbi:putative amidase [Naematelia encephala]|uniref:amidase n=1 Tax=Naematelia encephala TaxID=71784 RepID=A0A1Y2AK12_9TREE|nr:putative amidase [Naematelia encephala]
MSPSVVPPDYYALAAKAIAARDSCIPAEYRLPKSAHSLSLDVHELNETSDILTDEDREIINLSALQLRDAIVSTRYSAEDATKAYIKSASIAQQATNCLVEMFAGEALERARWLDQEFQRTGRVVGSLHGVPISIKDHISVKDHDSPSGFLSLVDKMVCEEDAHLVKILREAGAVFYVKTTNPQSLMQLETRCYLGITYNPYNIGLTSGGSSGGEGALISMKGSCLGVGTDIGGSIRTPAANCGIYGFKPSVGRIPYGGANTPMGPVGYDGILCTHGPMARSVDDLELYMRTLLAGEPWLVDPSLSPRPWSPMVQTEKKLRIGILRSDGVVTPVAPIRRAMEAVIGKLQETGNFEMVDFEPFNSARAWGILSALYWPDGGEVLEAHLRRVSEPMDPLTDWIISWSGRKPMSGKLQRELVAARDTFRRELAAHWQKIGIDVLLCPVGPSPAPPHGTSKYWNYTSYWNLANYPAAVLPTGLTVDPVLDTELKCSGRNADEDYIYANYDAVQSQGAPLSLQVVGYAFDDEMVIAALKQMDLVLNGPKGFLAR